MCLIPDVRNPATVALGLNRNKFFQFKVKAVEANSLVSERTVFKSSAHWVWHSSSVMTLKPSLKLKLLSASISTYSGAEAISSEVIVERLIAYAINAVPPFLPATPW